MNRPVPNPAFNPTVPMRLLVLLAFVCLPACAAPQVEPSDPSVDELTQRVEQLNKEVKAIIGEAVCRTDTDCRLIGYGAKPCGGPGSYLPYSRQGTNVSLLERKVAELNATTREIHRKRQVLSTCMVAPEPTVMCIESRCAAK
jgi:hypothetical protein